MERSDGAETHSCLTEGVDKPAPTAAPVPKNDRQNTDYRCPESVNDKSNDLQSGMLLWTKVVGVFTAVLSIVGFFQFMAFVQSERAFVFPSKVSFGEFTLNPDLSVMPIELDIELENSGKSTARINRLVVAISHDLPEHKPDYTRGGVNYTEFGFPPIPTDQKISQNLSFSLWSTNTAKAVRSGDMNFYAFGLVEYRDDYWFWRSRSSEFCFRYIANRTDARKSHFRTCTNPEYTNTN